MNIVELFQSVNYYAGQYVAGMQSLDPTTWIATGAVVCSIPILAEMYYKMHRAQKDANATHGSARWPEADEIQNMNILHDGTRRAIFGSYKNEFVGPPPTSPHVLMYAPTGAGKTVTGPIPTALCYQGGLVLNDPKGELTAITANRREALGKNVVVLDPWGVAQKLCGRTTNHVNPLAYINIDSLDAPTDVHALMRTICGKPFDGGANAYFYQSAEGLIKFYILVTLIKHRNEPEKANLVTVQNYVKGDIELVTTLLNEAATYKECDGIVAREALSFLSLYLDRSKGCFSDKYDSFKSNASLYLQFLDDLHLRNFFKKHDCDLSAIQENEDTVYIVVDPTKSDNANVFLRLMYGSIIFEQMRLNNDAGIPMLIVIDELVRLGSFALLEEQITIVRSYNIRFFLILQNRSQLKRCYKDASDEIEANCMSVVFCPSLLDDCKYISERLGQKTILTKTKDGKGHITISEAGRPLLTPEEVARLPRNDLLCFMVGERASKIRHIKYYKDRRFKGLYDPKHHGSLVKTDTAEEETRANAVKQ